MRKQANKERKMPVPTRPLLLALLLLPALFCIACANKQVEPNPALLTAFPAYGAAPVVRVLLAEASQRAALKIEAKEARVIVDGRRVDASESMTVNQGETGALWELVPTGAPQAFSLDGRTYRGKLRIAATEKGWQVINIVDLEQYVAGVIGWEMMRSWPIEALAVQAVASRTYALFCIQERRNSGDAWDIDDSTRFQVYGGVGPSNSPNLWRESDNVLKARELTSGQVLTYKGKGFKAFFHSTSGGITTSPEAAFGMQGGLEPLNGSDLGEFCKDSPKFNWSVRLGKGEVNARLIEWRVGISDCIRISVTASAPSGHAMTLRLFSRDGKSVEVRAIDFRFKMGLPSTHFEAAREGNEWVFTGKGYGHGCGMCQWSAHGMAKAGWNHDKILRAMYPGAEVETLY
jgi:stage II sporulation protein D